MIYWDKAQDALAGHEWVKVTRKAGKHHPGGVWLDNIFSIDTETTSAFLTPDGDIIPYDYNKPNGFHRGEKDFWATTEKFGWVYIWMFGVDDLVFYGRTLPELRSFLELLDDVTQQVEKIVYCHNLAFDWQFLRNCLPFEQVFARAPRKVLTADCMSLHLHFRCSLFLVNLSLAKWAKARRLPVEKLEGDLEYNKIRTPVGEYSYMTPQELAYCEHDILVMWEGLRLYRGKYGHVYQIPLTQTGEVRKAVAARMMDRRSWKRRCADLMPKTLDAYRFLMKGFFGGDVHAQYMQAGRTLHNVRSVDFSSSYPWVMISEKFPLTVFTPVNQHREQFMDNPYYCYMITFEAINVESVLFNTFLSRSRCEAVYGEELDNGRVLSAKYIRCTMCNPDFEIFRESYVWSGDINILDFRVAVAGYMDEEFCRYVVDLYENKTQYKGDDEFYDLYMWCKQLINGLYGDQVTRDFEGLVTWDPETGAWGFDEMTPEGYLEKAAQKRRNFPMIYKAAQCGLYVTAYARRNLWYLIRNLDYQTCYFDTDSCKFTGNDIRGVIPAYNMQVLRTHYEIAERLGIDVSRLSPCDPSGHAWPIGVAADEGIYADFKTLGAKKYCCRKAGSDKIEITIAGVPKGYAKNLRSVDDLDLDTTFPPQDEKDKYKAVHYYNDDQPALEVGGWIMDQRYGVCLQPTGYSVSLTKDYLALIAANMPMAYDFMDFLKAEGKRHENTAEVLQ